MIIYLTFNLSLVIWMMRTFFDGLPRSLEEAAEIDGADPWGAFLRITLPLAGPGHHGDLLLSLRLE
jgi:multiple sugar transport system permease protein